jgi:glycosyltransferase involved in cell wall biosynthesis
MRKKTLLLCMPDIPFPARKNGISIRYYPIIEHMQQSFDIHLVVITNGKGDTEIDQAGLTEAQGFCSLISIYRRLPKKLSPIYKLYTRLKTCIPGGVPYPEFRYDYDEISNFIKHETDGRNYDVALCVLIPYLPLVKKWVSAKKYSLDVIDSPHSTYVRKAGKSLIGNYDAWMVMRWERKLLKLAESTCYISALDRKLGAGDSADTTKIAVIPNGLFLHDHTDEKVDYPCDTVGYLGHMGYPPNIKAALRLYNIFIARKQDLPNTKLVIIGRDPAPEILALADDPDVVVTGTVNNIWPYVNAVDIFVFPMEIGSGQQNKLLEAMGAGKLVITSALGNSGIGAQSPQELIVANTDPDIGNALVEFSGDHQRIQEIGQRAKAFIIKTYSWNSIFGEFDRHLLDINK